MVESTVEVDTMTNHTDSVWRKVEIKGLEECWPWKGYRNWTKDGKGGYGRLDILGIAGVYAHRAAYLSANPGSISLNARGGVNVLHRCDNPICCNPAHLFLGTHADNAADMVAKNRQVKYPSCTGPRCKLTEDEVRNIRELKAAGATKRAISMLYDVSMATINGVCYGRHYKGIV
jgi:hypothetical protein